MRVKDLRRRIGDPFATLGARLAVACASRMSDRLAAATARLLAACHVTLVPGARRLVQTNLKIAFPDWDEARRRQVGYESLVHFIRNTIDFARCAQRPGLIDRLVDLDDADGQRLVALADRPTGILMAVPHLGSWEMLGHAGPRAGLRAAAVAKTFRNPGLDRLMVRWRQATGLQIIPAKGAVKALLRAVHDGRHVGILMDQNTHPRRGGIFVDFFGLPATVTRSPAMLARKLDLEVAINTFVREGDRFRFRTRPLPRATGDYDDDLALTRDMVRGIEALIRRYPEQYVWLYKRWRYIPAGCSPDAAARFPDYAHPIADG